MKWIQNAGNITKLLQLSPDVNGLRERLKSDFQSRSESRRGRRGRGRLRRGALDVVDLRHVRRLLHLEK